MLVATQGFLLPPEVAPVYFPGLTLSELVEPSHELLHLVSSSGVQQAERRLARLGVSFLSEQELLFEGAQRCKPLLAEVP